MAPIVGDQAPAQLITVLVLTFPAEVVTLTIWPSTTSISVASV